MCSNCIAALHNKCFPSGQKVGIVHPVDAHGGFPPSAAASAVPLWRFFNLHTSWAAVSAGPFFLPACESGLSEMMQIGRNLPVVLGYSLRSCVPIPLPMRLCGARFAGRAAGMDGRGETGAAFGQNDSDR